MAKLSDLPDDLVRSIIHHIIHKPARKYDHHDLDHHELKESRKKPRPHLREKNASHNDWYITRGSQFSARLGKKEYSDRLEDFKLHRVSWPQGLPCNPLVSLSLMNRAFQRCAQEELFQNVAIEDQWQGCLFLQALTRSTPSDKIRLTREEINNEGKHNHPGDRSQLAPSSAIDPSCGGTPARYVRSIQFMWSRDGSMGKGGGSLICDILSSCPLLENIAISPTFWNHCHEPILEALANRPLIREFVILMEKSNAFSAWGINEVVTQLCPRWKFLETIELHEIFPHSGDVFGTIPQPLPAMNCAIRTIILKEPKLGERELSWFLKSFIESIQTLEISDVKQVDRAGLCRILIQCTGPSLESLKISAPHCCYDQGRYRRDPEAYMISLETDILDNVFKFSSALKNLKSLSIHGPLFGSELFTLLPQSLVKLALSHHSIPYPALFEAITSLRGSEDTQSFQ
ncbi:hypothetical protein PCANC_17000 [Puccinia coronata f. sp. avenae]|uniref:F-box domain-containing protein n=1 Tax=Puccinia coronata f. sp. avenae TaxID=200324 RepID=A0A2N5SLR5_9BASI|nr:hypothetical protein PCANC_17000 [Puccinia coronata f. sp. avenae]